MTENSTTTGGTDSESETEFVPLGSENEEETNLPEELIEIDDDGSDDEDVPGTGAVSGGFGFAGLALAIVSLTTNWTANVEVSHAQYVADVKGGSNLSTQDNLNIFENGWHTQGYFALVFAAAAVLFGAGALLSPSILLSGRTPGWAKAAATSAIIVGVVGVVLALLTVTGVFGGHIVAPATSS
jgi:hypothetical protein